MMNKAPEYPGYGKDCNGCGQCCLSAPCVVASKYGLWRHDLACIAHKFRGGRWWCDFAVDPGRYVARYRRINRETDLKVIHGILGITGICTTRRMIDITHCDYCQKTITKKFGIDLSHRVYCHRLFCRYDKKIKLLMAKASGSVDRIISKIINRVYHGW